MSLAVHSNNRKFYVVIALVATIYLLVVESLSADNQASTKDDVKIGEVASDPVTTTTGDANILLQKQYLQKNNEVENFFIRTRETRCEYLCAPKSTPENASYLKQIMHNEERYLDWPAAAWAIAMSANTNEDVEFILDYIRRPRDFTLLTKPQGDAIWRNKIAVLRCIGLSPFSDKVDLLVTYTNPVEVLGLTRLWIEDARLFEAVGTPEYAIGAIVGSALIGLAYCNSSDAQRALDARYLELVNLLKDLDMENPSFQISSFDFDGLIIFDSIRLGAISALSRRDYIQEHGLEAFLKDIDSGQPELYLYAGLDKYMSDWE